MVVGLTKIRGVGYMFANTIINVLKINPDQRIGYLSSEQVKSIENIIKNPSAKALRTSTFRPRVVQSKKKYIRKKIKLNELDDV